MTEFTRRKTMIGLGATTAGMALVGCASEPASLAIAAQAQPGMNPGPDGSDRPVTVTVVQMSGTGAFDGADALSLSDPQSAIGGDFVNAQQIVLAPGGSGQALVPILPGTTAVGFVVGLRNPDGRVFRQRIPAPGGPANVAVAVGPGGLSVS